METIVITPDLSNTLIAASTLASLHDTAPMSQLERVASTSDSLEMAKTPLDDDEENEDEDDDLEDDDEDDDDIEDDDLEDEDEDDDLEDDEDNDDEDEDIEDDDDPKPLRVKTQI